MLYTVIWTIDIDAPSPEAAAREAKAIQQDPQSIANVFEVRRATRYRVDLDEKPATKKTL
jgi:hypothetical protein